MASTYTQTTIIALVNQVTGRSDLSAFTDDYLNMALYRMARSHNWRILQAEAEVTAAVGAMSGAFPTTSISGAAIAVKSVMSARVGQTAAVNHLAWLPASKFDLLYPDGASSTAGRPLIACDWNQIIRWHPKTDVGYILKLRVNCWPQPMVAGSGFRFDDWCVDTAVAATALETFLALGKRDQTEHWLQVYKDKVSAAAAADAQALLPHASTDVPPISEPGVNPAGV